MSSEAADRPQPDSDTLHIGRFSQGQLHGWEPTRFVGETDYRIVTDPTTNPPRKVLRASSHQAASGLVNKQRIDLDQTPIIHWSWKTDQLFTNLNERTKAGDDFVARLYVIVDGGLFFWRTQALNYVWSATSAVGDSWPNPYTANATMLTVESGPQQLGQWQHYSRDLRKDLTALLGKDIRYIDAVAVMTDTDNGGQQATTDYGDIFFTATPPVPIINNQ